MTVKHGVDVEKMGKFVEGASQAPSNVQLRLRAKATYEGTCAHSLAKVRGYDVGDQTIDRDTREFTIPYGGWREVLEQAGWVGATDRPEPIEVALSALASCINVGISINALAHGADIKTLETRVQADFNPGVLFSLQGVDASEGVFRNVTAQIRCQCDGASEEQLAEWARRAPVFALTALPQDIELNIETM